MRRAVGSFAVALLVALTTACASGWQVKRPNNSAFDNEPRVEIIVRDSWVGMGEDRFGVPATGTSLDVRIARFCNGAWAVTYLAAAESLPAPGSEVTLSAISDGNEPVSSVGMMLDNGVTALFQPMPAIDDAMFINGPLRVVVATPSGEQVSLSDAEMKSRATFGSLRVRSARDTFWDFPDDLKRICPSDGD